MNTKYVIFQGKEMLVECGSENWKDFIVVDGNKVFASNATPYFKYTKEGLVNDVYTDCVRPVDKYGCIINIGDTLYASIKGEVSVVTVKKIADVPYHLGYGCHRRKLTVTCTDTKKTFTLPAGDRCIKQ